MKSKLPIEDIGVGAFLAQERHARGISLAEVSEKTCIRIFYLEKIEADAFGELPSIPVGRGFVKSYAGYIGVDADNVVRVYNQKVGGRTEDIDGQLGSKIIYSKANSNRESKQLLVPIVGVLLFILMSGALLWFVRGKTESLSQYIGFSLPLQSKNSPDSGKTTSEVRNENFDGAPQKSSSSEMKNSQDKAKLDSGIREVSSSIQVGEIPGVSPGGSAEQTKPSKSIMGNAYSPGASKKLIPRSNRLILKIIAEEDTWLRVVVDQNVASEVFLTAGSEKIWSGNDKFVLTVGNSKGTKVFLNGVSVTLPKTASNVVRDFLITDKVAEIIPNLAGN